MKYTHHNAQLSANAAADRVRRLRGAGVITGFTALVDPGAGGRKLEALVGVTVAPDGDVYAFLMPPANAGDPLAVTGGGETVVAFNEGDAITAVLAHMSSDTFANLRVEQGGTVSANNGVDPSKASSPLLEQTIEILQDPNTTFRYDGSDLMPGAVGANSFWKGSVAWLTGDSTQQVVDSIESSWPAS